MTADEANKIIALCCCWFHVSGYRHEDARRKIKALLKDLDFETVEKALRAQSIKGERNSFCLNLPAVFATLNSLAEDQRDLIRWQKKRREEQAERKRLMLQLKEEQERRREREKRDG